MSNKFLVYLILILVVLAIFYFLNQNRNSFNHPLPFLEKEGNSSTTFKPDSSNIYLLGNFKVDYITDGDTFHVKDSSGKEIIIRVLVVNTPEIHNDTTRNICLGNISKNFTKNNLLGKEVELWGDSTQPKLDKYGRTLAYVRIVDQTSSVASTTMFFNDVLMQTGMAKVYKANPPGTYYQKYLSYQKQAQLENLGMWNSQTCK